MITLFQIRYIFVIHIHMSERGIKMECESTLTKRFLVLLLMLGMLVTLIFCFSGSAEAATQEDSINKAVNWLNLNQDETGRWGNSDVSFLDTSEVSEYLTKYKALTDNLQKSAAWMQKLELLNNDTASRVLPYITSSDKYSSVKEAVKNSQNPDGGWGIAEGYESDVLDTVIVINSLIDEKNVETYILKRAVSYIISTQNSNGSWSLNDSDDATISLTAQAAITLNSFQTKTNLTSNELQTALRKAGEYLVSVQKADKTWGTDEESIADTLLSYRAVLNTVGLEAVKTVDSSILDIQNSDGSWYESPYITALAIKAIKERMDMPSAEISSIKLYKNENGTKTECYSFNAYEAFEIQAESTSNNIDSKLLYFVKKADGSVVAAQTDGLPGWNTKNTKPGDYSVIVQVKDSASGRIVASKEKQFVINPYFEVRNVILTTDPENVRINNNCTVNAQTTLVSDSNVDRTLTLKTSVIDSGTVIKEETKTIQSKSADQITKAEVITFIPDVTVSKDYIIKTEVLEGSTKLTQAESTFKVLPPLPPTRIDADQSLSKPVLYPGQDSVTAKIKLTGEGIPEMPQRNPIDMVICIDDSGSMEWGNADNSTTKPWRIDFAKDASKRVVELLQKQDRGAVVEFAGSSSIWIQQDLTGDKELIKKSISQTPGSPWNGTDIAGAISKSIDILDQKSSADRDKIIILISDGVSDTNAINIVNTAKTKGYKIYTIALGDGADKNLMSTISQITQGKYVYSPTMEQLDGMMNILAGEIFDTAGKNVVFETTIPANGMIVDTSKISPVPTSIISTTGGAIALKWTLDRLVMGEEKVFTINYTGTDLPSDTEVILTQNTKLTYQDRNGTTVTKNLPDFKIPVSKYMLDSKVSTDKKSYTANEDVSIKNIAQNLTDYPATLTAKVEVTDANGNIVKTITKNESGTWNSNETRTLNFSWNTGTTMTGTYKARVTWSEGEKVISVADTSFDITENSTASAIVVVDKQKYTADEDVHITSLISNNSTNNIQRGLTARTSIKNPKGEVIWKSDATLPEILQTSQATLKNVWNTAKNPLGQYTVTMELFKDTEMTTGSSITVTTSSSISFEIISQTEEITGVSGGLELQDKKIYGRDNVELNYSIKNTGNIKLDNVTARIRIVDASSEAVIGTITDVTSLDVSTSHEGKQIWTHEPLKKGNYMVILDAILSDGKQIPLASNSFTVGEISVPTTISTDKYEYSVDDTVNITGSAINLTDKELSLNGRVFIIGPDGTVIKNIDENLNVSLKTSEGKDFKYNWNVNNAPAGEYKVKIIWARDGIDVSSAETTFKIIDDKNISCTIDTDKKKYISGDEVNIKDIVINHSQSYVHKDLRVRTSIKNAEGEIIWSVENNISELLTEAQTQIKNIWNIPENLSGQYSATIEVYNSKEKLVASSITVFEIVKKVMDVSGSFEVLNKNIYSRDNIGFKYIINNTGNVNLNNIAAKITIVESATESVIGTITESINIDTSSSYTGEKVWTHEPLDPGDYIVTLDVTLPDGRQVTIGKDSFNVKKPNVLLSDAFKYTLFSGDTENSLRMKLYKGTINGGVHTNKNLEYSGTSLSINGMLSSIEKVDTNGSTIQFNQMDKAPTILEIPNVVNDIRMLASRDANIRKSSLTINEYRNGIILSKSEINKDSIQIYGTSLSTKGYIVANNSITLNLDSMTSTSPKGIVICSANSDITINVSNVNLNGIIYAPQGTVYINSNDFKLKGRIIAKRIVVQSTNFEVTSTEKDLDLMDISLID